MKFFGFKFLISVFLFLTIIFASNNSNSFSVSKEFLKKVEKQYNIFAVRRVLALVKMMNRYKNADEMTKLKVVNDFFNQIPYQSDIKTWGKKDYWATRLEFLGKDRGDCEDYAIAKFFTLKQMGVSTKKMYLTYAKSRKYKVAHMVLTYFKTPKSIPLVLGNYNKKILPADKRRDLIPVYSFNGEELYLAKQKSLGKLVPNGMNKNKKWDVLMKKIKRNKDDTF